MKFLPKLRACLGGATIAPTAETTTTATEFQRRQNDITRPRRSTTRVNNSKRASNWKPKLRVISEDVAMGDTDRSSGAGGERTVRSSDKKPAVKAKTKSMMTKVSERSRHADDYPKNSRPIPIPAFSPAPFFI